MGVRLEVLGPQGVRGAGVGEPSSREGTELAAYEFEQDRIVLGRGAGADVRLPHPTVSLRHASLRLEEGRFVLVDHGATNGTRLGDHALVAERPKALRDGDVLTLGPYRLRFHAGIAVREPTSRERTASLARRLARETSLGAGTSAPRLIVVNGEKKGSVLVLPDPPARLVIGRGEATDLPLPDADASREHCEILVEIDGPLLRDLGSKNGLLVNEKPVTQKRLRDRDEITVGATVLGYEDPAEALLQRVEALADEPAPPPVAPPPVPAAAQDVASEEGKEAPTEPERPIATVAPPRAGLSRAEVLVGWLAAAVLLLSLAGLYWLLRA